MKRNLRYALLASAAVLALGMVTPSQAQQYIWQAPVAGYGAYAYAPGEAYGYGPGEAYGYVPGGLAGDQQGCAIEGTYGKGLDYSICGGGD